MGTHAASDVLEQEAYRASYSDGIIDLFGGLSLLWIGAAWVWLPGIAGLAGILPAVLVTPVLSARTRYMESRSGYVRWRAPRRRWERRNLSLLLVAGIVVLGLAVSAFVLAKSGSSSVAEWPDVGPGLIAWLIAFISLVLAAMLRTWRLVGYAFVLMLTGSAAAVLGTNPGWPLLASGLVVTLSGAAMLRRYAGEHPTIAPA